MGPTCQLPLCPCHTPRAAALRRRSPGPSAAHARGLVSSSSTTRSSAPTTPPPILLSLGFSSSHPSTPPPLPKQVTTNQSPSSHYALPHQSRTPCRWSLPRSSRWPEPGVSTKTSAAIDFTHCREGLPVVGFSVYPPGTT
jgi:hypothetical protein